MSDTITIRFPRKLHEELEHISIAENVSQSEIILEAVSRYLAIRKFRQLRNVTLPFAEAQGLLADEDVFKSIS